VHPQNVSDSLSVKMSTSTNGPCSALQLPSGLRVASPPSHQRPGERPDAWEKRPVPPSIVCVCWTLKGRYACPRIDRERRVQVRRDEMHDAGGEHQVVAADVLGIVRLVGDLDDRPISLNPSLATTAMLSTTRVPEARRDDGAAERLGARRSRHCRR
jgi:hypothetical protein